MISKILKLKNLGRLNIPTNDVSENRSDDFSFKKNTLIFGDNTYGKTTLVSVFKSLQTGEPLENRKKFKSQNSIEIKIENFKNTQFTFHEYGKESWKNSDILIFDNDFIKDHIFSEDQIKGEHLKSLPKILIGNTIKQDIDHINSIIKCEIGNCGTCEFCLNTKVATFKNTFNKSYVLDDFLKVNNEIENVDQKIKESENILSVDEKLSELKEQSQRSIFHTLDIDAFEELFKNKINNVFESLINQHLLENTNNLDKAKGFLDYGLKLKKGNICPFCSQDTQQVEDFMNNLSKYFDKEYLDFKDRIEKESNLFLSFDLEKELLSFEKLGFLEIEESINKEKIEEVLKNIKLKIERKKEDLNFDCNFEGDQDFVLLKQTFSNTKALLGEVIKKQALTHPEKTTINSEVITLKLNKYRYSMEGSEFFNKYEIIESELKDKNKTKVLAQTALKEKVEEIFKNNLSNINTFLKELKADFQITRLQPSVDNRDKNNYLKISEYLFEFIDIQGNSISVEIEKFKETFSDSDKRLLGFAFFLSSLKNDFDLENKIIILDDPFSSFDINRKEETIKLFDSIKNLESKEPRQKIVFTHEKSFYCQLNKLISSNDKKLLKLNCSVANDGSMLELVDIKKFESDKYYTDLDYINKAINTNNNLDEALPKVRECVEYLLRAKYVNTLENYRDENGNPINFNIDSINSFLKAIDNKCAVKTELLELELHKFHHNQPQWKTDLSDTGKNKILKDFVGLIEKI